MLRPVLLLLPLLLASAAPDPSLSTFLSATHWSPCYYLSSLPSLWDGCAALARTGTRAIKLILDGSPDDTYPWNTAWGPVMANVSTLAELAATELYDTALRGRASPLPAWEFDVFSLVSYSLGTGGGNGWNYWCTSFTEADAAGETAEFSGLTQHLLSAFLGGGKRFMLEHWEGDWSARCGSYDAKTPAAPAVQARMVQWLAARQAGVTAGRLAWCAAHPALFAGGAGDCRALGAAAIHAAAGVEVLHASEVNLVLDAMTSGFPDNILRVIPQVALDMVSYSSYDSMALSPGFAQALDFIAAHHLRTEASPEPAVYVAEFGVAENEEGPRAVRAVYENVIKWAWSRNANGVRRAAHVFAWETFDNEVHTASRAFPGGRCNAATGPQLNASLLNGFWLLRPDGSEAPAFHVLASLLNGSAPMPTPQPPLACAFTPDTDLTNCSGFEVPGASQQDCCTACQGDARCTAAVFSPSSPEGQQCWVKYGGTPVAKKGATMCVPEGRGE